MNEGVGIAGTIIFMIGIGLCFGEISFGVILVVVGIILIYNSTKTKKTDSKINDNNVKEIHAQNTYSSSQCSNKEYYKKYVRVRFQNSSKVYTYLSNPNYPLFTGDCIAIKTNFGSEIVYVVEGDKLLPEKTDMHYKMIEIDNEYRTNKRNPDRFYDDYYD